MRPSRTFQPTAPTALETRAVLSTINPGGVMLPVAVVQTSPATVPGAPAPGQSTAPFTLDISQTLDAGLPVYEQKTIIDHPSGTVETEDILTVPDPAHGTTTTTEWINLPSKGGIETVVNVKTQGVGTTTQRITTTLPTGQVQTEVETSVVSGHTTSFTLKTTLPTGQVETNTYQTVQNGSTTLIRDGTIHEADGTLETYSGRRVKVGETTTTDETYRLPKDKVRQTHTVSQGDSGSTTTTTTITPHQKPVVTRSVTSIARFTPPAGA